MSRSPKMTALFYLLLIGGTIAVLVSSIIKVKIDDNAALEAERLNTQKYRAIADLMRERIGYEQARQALADQVVSNVADAARTNIRLKESEIVIKGLDEKIRSALQSIPAEQAEQLKREAAVDLANKAAEAKAIELDLQILPVVDHTLGVIRTALQKASREPDWGIRSISSVTVARAMLNKEQRKIEPLAADVLTVDLDNDSKLVCRLNLGATDAAVSAWPPPVSKIGPPEYKLPSIDICEQDKVHQELGLGTITFDEKTLQPVPIPVHVLERTQKELANASPDPDAALAAFIIELLRDNRVRH